MLDCGAERVVVGRLCEEGTLDEAYLDAMLDAAGDPERLVWHRAIDVSKDALSDVRVLLDKGVQAVLTSGGAIRAVEGSARIGVVHRPRHAGGCWRRGQT